LYEINSGKSIKAITIIMQTAIRNAFVIIYGGALPPPKKLI